MIIKATAEKISEIIERHYSISIWWLTMAFKANKEEVAKAMTKAARRIEDTGDTRAGKLALKMRRMADDVREFSLDDYKEKMIDNVDSARVELDRNVDNVKEGIRDRPLECVAIAAGTGIVLGAAIALMGRRTARKMSRM
jgi:ElaB/YqjD/DUF883 family membrane-anchored ribosome-binding protein